MSRNSIKIEGRSSLFPETKQFIELRIKELKQLQESSKLNFQQIVRESGDGDMMDERLRAVTEQELFQANKAYLQALADLDKTNLPSVRSNVLENRVNLGDVVTLDTNVRYRCESVLEHDRFELPNRIVIGLEADVVYLKNVPPFDGKSLDILSSRAPFAQRILGQPIGYMMEMEEESFVAEVVIVNSDRFLFTTG